MAYESKKPEPLKDDSLMPSGKHVGERMIDIPARYLLYVYDNNMCSKLVRNYIEENLDVIKSQAKTESEGENRWRQ